MPCNKKNLTRNQMKKEKNPRFGWGGEWCFGDLLLLFGYSASEIEFGKNFEKIVQRKFYFGKKMYSNMVWFVDIMICMASLSCLLPYL